MNITAPFFSGYLQSIPIILAMATTLWLISLVKRDSSIVDPFWSTLFMAAAMVYFLEFSENRNLRHYIIMLLVSIWGIRLFLHLLIRNWNKGEDYRYQEFRMKWGKNYWWGSFFQVFLLQGFLAWLISSTLAFAFYSANSLGFIDYIAITLWLIGFYFEALGDYQLVKFKANPENKGKLLTSGLWKYSRHPNYFGDAACWWAYGLLAISAGNYLGIVGSIIMTWLLLNVSGVGLLEKSMSKKKPGYEEYMRKTSAFIPLPPNNTVKP